MRPATSFAPALLSLAACASSGAAPSSPLVSPAPATSLAPLRALAPAADDPLHALEQRLLSARSIHMRVRVATSGRIQSHFEGTIDLGEGQRARFALEGAFGQKDVDVRFVSDGTHMEGGPRGQSFAMDVAPAIREGIVLGFVRMGITHDLAMLSSGRPPDYIDGSARKHLEVVGAAHAPGEAVRGAPTEQWTWALFVDHQRSADETLWVDAKTGLPVRRRVVVHFPEGDMDDGEEYEETTLDAPVGEDTFRIGPPLAAGGEAESRPEEGLH